MAGMPGDALLIGIAQLAIVVAGFTAISAMGSIVLFGLDALVFGSLTVYALALCVQLSVAAISFYDLVSTATRSTEGT